MGKIFFKLTRGLLLSLLFLLPLIGCMPKYEFWISNESNAEYKIEILFKRKYNLEGFNALFGYKFNKPVAVARTPVPSYDNMFFQADINKKNQNRLTESDFQYNPDTATFYYTLKPRTTFLLEEATDQNESQGIELIQELKFITKDGEILYRGKEIRKLFLTNKYLTIVLK
ncbi:MAG: hypothetical protein KBF93_17955 [Leptospiraceae bacterium]|nr:hypothetical protein [Leptospiraceae bacterium]